MRRFLWQVHKCVAAGGKVLIPVFALGRAQVVISYLNFLGIQDPQICLSALLAF